MGPRDATYQKTAKQEKFYETLTKRFYRLFNGIELQILVLCRRHGV